MLNQLAGIALNPDSLSWLLRPDQFKAELLTRIAAAKHHIIFTALYLEDDEAGREILQALMNAKAANPQLQTGVLVDFHRARRGLIGHQGDSGNYLMYRQVMAEAQYPIRILGVPVKTRELMGVLHLKGFVIDDAVIYSGASLNNIYLQQKDKYRFDRYHVIESAALAKSMREMVENYLIQDPAVSSLAQPAHSEILPEKSIMRSFKKRLALAEYKFSGVTSGLRVTPLMGLGRKNNKLNEVILELVKTSQESLFICTPYFNPPMPLVRVLSKHLKQGKTIDIVVGDKTANDFYIPPTQEFKTIGGIPYLYEMALRKFVEKHQWAIDQGLLNIHLWKHDANSYHLKGVSVDGRYHLLTGSNLNPRAWALDIENGLLIHDLQQSLQAQFEIEQKFILQHTQRLYHSSQLENPRSYPEPVRKLLGRINRVKADILLKRIL